MTSALRFLFWLSWALITYVYAVYPFMIHRLSKLAGRRYEKGDVVFPVSIIITAFNEEQSIADKIENTLALDYPRELMEIIVGSDGSYDRTARIVRSYAGQGIKLLHFDVNRGKTSVQNDCVKEACHDIIVFMDAASLCDRDCLKKLVANFADARVGAVAGRVVFIQDRNNITTESQGVYWKYEQVLKKAESSLGSLVGVDGPLYAVRKELYEHLDGDMMSDFISPLLLIRNGYSVVYEPEAITYEEAKKKAVEELKTRRRIVTRGLVGLSRHTDLINPVSSPMLSWQIFSHKILRWFAGFYYIGMLASSLMLVTRWFFLLSFGGLLSILCLSYCSLWIRDNPPRWFTIPYYFMLVNLAAVLGAIDYVRGVKVISWKPVR